MSLYQAELILKVFEQAKKDIVDFLFYCTPTELKKLYRSEILSSKSPEIEYTTWHPSTFNSAIEFFDSSLFTEYCEILDLHVDKSKELIEEQIKAQFGGLPSIGFDLCFNVDGVGEVSAKKSMARTIEVLTQLTKEDIIVWKESETSYSEVRGSFEEFNQEDLAKFTHHFTYLGTSSRSDILYYLGAFIKTDDPSSKYRKYLLLIVTQGEGNKVYELTNTGRLVKVVTEMFASKDERVATKRDYLDLISVITKKEGYTHNEDLSRV